MERALAHPKAYFGRVALEVCTKIKPDYKTIKLSENMRLGETKPTSSGSYFGEKLLSSVKIPQCSQVFFG